MNKGGWAGLEVAGEAAFETCQVLLPHDCASGLLVKIMKSGEQTPPGKWMFLTNKIMKSDSISMWKKARKGPRSILLWCSIVAAAGFFFAAVETAHMYLYTPWALYAWSAGLDYHIRVIPALLIAIIGLAMMGSFITAMAVVFTLYCLMRRLFARRVPDTQPPVGDVSKITS